MNQAVSVIIEAVRWIDDGFHWSSLVFQYLKAFIVSVNKSEIHRLHNVL